MGATETRVGCCAVGATEREAGQAAPPGVQDFERTSPTNVSVFVCVDVWKRVTFLGLFLCPKENTSLWLNRLQTIRFVPLT